MQAAGRASLILQVAPRFVALDTAGAAIPLTQKKGCILLTMVACAPGMRRSRDWLRRHLWHRAYTSHGFSSLRQCLHNLRSALGPQGACLGADRDFIWLQNTRVDWGFSSAEPNMFLEDVPRLDGPARDWREEQRDRLRRGQAGGAVMPGADPVTR